MGERHTDGGRSESRWVAPIGEVYKLNVDDAFKVEQGVVGVGYGGSK